MEYLVSMQVAVCVREEEEEEEEEEESYKLTQ